MYNDRTAWRCEFFVGKKYGSKGYPKINAAHMGSICRNYNNNSKQIMNLPVTGLSPQKEGQSNV
jgi:hypothetical protein